MLNFDWLSGLPLGSAILIIILLFVLLRAFVFRQKDVYVFEGFSRPRFYHNLKYWTYLILILLSLIYFYF